MIIHTLGPQGTNCERAAREYMKRTGMAGEIVLHSTLEEAAGRCVRAVGDERLLGCIVYPDLHEIVFQNLTSLYLLDCFVMDTYEMVFASRLPNVNNVRRVGTHPAPKHLIDMVEGLQEPDITLCASNAAAAERCRGNEFDACVTTANSAQHNELAILRNFGPVSMGFCVHAKSSLKA